MPITLAIEGPAGQPPASRPPEVPPALARPRFVDREADPFLVVPEVLVGWLPRRSDVLLPLFMATAAALVTAVAGGSLAAFWLLRR